VDEETASPPPRPPPIDACTMLIQFLFVITAAATLAEREHKVHNIILYPEKYSWCQTTPIQQVVASPGYEPVTIDNNVCVGACYSYSIPSTQPAEPGELIGPYCDSCQPVETKCYHVTLQADSKNSEGPKTFQKRVQIILKCSCISCEKTHREDCEITDQTTLELPHDLFSNRSQESKTEEVPELLHFAPNKKRPLNFHFDFSNTTNEQRYELNSKLINLLKSIQNEGDDSNISYDKNQLIELLKIIEGSENELSDKNLMEFVNFVNIHNSEDLELDLSRLKEVLTTFQKNQNILTKHRDFGFGQGQKNNADIERDLKKYNLPSTFGLEAAHFKHDADKRRNHHLGDEVHVGLDVGHLVKGPHGSMVLSPNLKVEEKLNIDSDVLKPNHDGVVITYENHDRNRKVNDILTN
jgi:neuroblastoma suppressor of tumorigenicity 1